MRYTLFSLAFLTAICFTACDDSKEYGDGLEEKTLISEITLANVENGKLTLAASVDYMDSLIQCKIVPEQPTNRKVSWSSSDENVATVCGAVSTRRTRAFSRSSMVTLLSM